ncbi:RidA family protein [Vagococcus sp. PNs007]|uniref:RidA family protein n=1 Tax=Vagococcus proximus TaxID=2991417 RepID=A0ABT5WZU1_9ENTE|nr:RidA family protein [Vagococcus proximus]MDF0479275.1 RidA family protein [Vagococcus proximus]
MKKEIKTQHAPKAIGPYSQGMATEQLLFISGQLPLNPETGEMGEDVVTQTKQSLSNLKAILEQDGLMMSDVVKTTIFVKDIEEFAAVNEVYGEFFSEPYPARSTIEVARLPKDAKVEIEAIVTRN